MPKRRDFILAAGAGLATVLATDVATASATQTDTLSVNVSAGTSTPGLIPVSVGDGSTDSTFTTPSGLVFVNGVAITESSSGTPTLQHEHTFELVPRSSSTLSWPVPTFRPILPNNVVALDVAPNGTPLDDPGNGTAWIDVCNFDVIGGDLGSGPNGGASARVAAWSNGVEVGSRAWGSAAQVPLWLTMGGTPALTIDTSGQPTFNFGKNNSPYIATVSNLSYGSSAYTSLQVVSSGGSLQMRSFPGAFSADPNFAAYNNIASYGALGLVISSTGNIRWTSGGTDNFRGLLDANGNWFFGPSSGLKPSSTNGFVSIPSASGAPTGTPATRPNCTPLYFDTAHNKLWAYNNGAWVGVSMS